MRCPKEQHPTNLRDDSGVLLVRSSNNARLLWFRIGRSHMPCLYAYLLHDETSHRMHHKYDWALEWTVSMRASSGDISAHFSDWPIASILCIRVRLHSEQQVLCKVQDVQWRVRPREVCVIAEREDSELGKLCLLTQPYWPEVLRVPLPRPCPFGRPSQSMNEDEIHLRFGRGVDQREAQRVPYPWSFQRIQLT